MTQTSKIMKRSTRLLTTSALVTLALGLGACERSKYSYDDFMSPMTTASVPAKKAKGKKTHKSKKAKHSSTKHAAAKKSKHSSYRLAVKPIGGLPKHLAGSFSKSMKNAINAKHIKLAAAKSHNDMKGFFAATPQQGKTKLSYVLDVTDKNGKRVQRIHGSQIVMGHPTDPWKHVSKSVLNRIAHRTATSLSDKLTGKTSYSVASHVARTKTAFKAAPKHTAALKAAPVRDRIAAIIPAVIGAPGDGKISLTRAIAQTLKQRGVKIERVQSPGVHSVKGFVSLKSFDAERDEITIKWLVFNSKGRRLGVVSQKNKIAKGSLNGSWGRIAYAAAGAASKGIRKLLPSKSN